MSYATTLEPARSWPDVATMPGFMRRYGWVMGQNAAGAWAQRHRPYVFVLSFKAMKKDLRGAVRSVAALLDISAPDALVDEVCRLSSFDYMKGIDHKFHMEKMQPWGEAGAMIRKGTQGGSSELLTPAQQHEIDMHCQTELRELGSDLPYTEFCDLAPASTSR